MATTVRVYVEDIATKIATYTTIRLYRGTTPAVTTSSTLAGSATLVAGQEAYSISDASGVAGSWYRYILYNATGPVESDLSPAWRYDGQSLRVIRLEAARDGGAGFDSTCTAVGTTTTLIDKALVDEGVDAEFLEGAWIYRPDAASAADRVRRVKPDGFAVSTFTLSIDSDRPWANAPANAEEYHIYNLVPPIDSPGQAYSWDRAIREGLTATKYVDELNLGVGGTGQTRFSLATHLGYVERSQVRGVFLRTEHEDTADATVYTYRDAQKRGGWWQLIENGAGSLDLEIQPPPAGDETIIVQVERSYDGLYVDTDVTDCPLEKATAATLWKLYLHLNTRFPGRFSGEYSLARMRWQAANVGRPPLVVLH